MKKVAKIISLVAASLLIIVGLLFIVIEGRTLFSLDWSIYENSVSGFFRYFFRLIIAIYSFSLGIFTYVIFFKKDNQILHIYFYISAATLFIMSIILMIYSTNYLNYVEIALSTLYLIGALIHYYSYYLKQKSNK